MALNGISLGVTMTATDLASRVISQFGNRLTAVKAKSEIAARKIDAAMSQMKRSAAGLAVGIIGLKALGGLSKSFETFEVGLVTAGNVMRATTGEMKDLKDAAIEAGIKTQFSPTEAIQGLQDLGAAGLSAKDAIEVLNPVLDLAAASLGQLGVSEAAQNVVGVLNAFGESAENAAKRVDQLVRVTQLSNFQARDFQIAISQSAAQANAANQSFESMIATLGLLRNTNVSASVAATSYREAVRRLAGDQKALNRLIEFGISPVDKATGKIRDIASITADLIPKVDSLNATQRNLVLTQIFGVRGMKTFNAIQAGYNKLLAEGKVASGDYAAAQRRMVEELKNSSGAAKDARDKFLKTAAGQRVLLKGSIETFKVMLGETITPILLPAITALKDILNAVIGVFRKIPGPIKELMATFVSMGLVVLTAVSAFKLLGAGLALLRLGGVISGVGRLSGLMGGLAERVPRLASSLGFVGRNLGVIAVAGVAAFSLIKQFVGTVTKSTEKFTEEMLEVQTEGEKRQAAAREKQRKLFAGVRRSQKEAQAAFIETEKQAKRAAKAAAEAAGKRLEESKAGKAQAKRALEDIQESMLQRIGAAKVATKRLAEIENKLGETNLKGARRASLNQEKIRLQREIEINRKVVNVQKFAEIRAKGIRAEQEIGRTKDAKKRVALIRAIAAGRVTEIRDIEEVITKEQGVAAAARGAGQIALAEKQGKKIQALRDRQAAARKATERVLGITKGDEKEVLKFMEKVAAPELVKAAQLDIGLRARAISIVKAEKVPVGGLSMEERRAALALAREGKVVPTGRRGKLRAPSEEFLQELRTGDIRGEEAADVAFRKRPMGPSFAGFGPTTQKIVLNMDGKKVAEILLGRIQQGSAEGGANAVTGSGSGS